MERNFDQIIDRRNTNSLKYDFAAERGLPADVLPLWVADMDFPAPRAVTDALKRASEFGIFGYSEAKDGYFQAVSQWYRTHFGWTPQPQWLVKTPGVVFSIAMAVRAYAQEGEGVLIQQPVYYPFSSCVLSNNRKLVDSPLVLKNGRYEMDVQDFEAKITANNVKLFLLCSPHNPVGRVWTREELEQVSQICRRHGVIIFSDEIHSDFTLPGHTHTILASLNQETADISITATAPSKTFNLAGLQTSNLFISNQDLRRKLKAEIRRSGYSQLNTMGLIACEAAYRGGEQWLKELKAYLWDNLCFVRTYLAQHLPQIKLIEPEGTYLIWLDCRGLGLETDALEDLIVNKAKLWLDSGAIFGHAGTGFQRINIACPRATLNQALEQLKAAVDSL